MEINRTASVWLLFRPPPLIHLGIPCSPPPRATSSAHSTRRVLHSFIRPLSEGGLGKDEDGPPSARVNAVLAPRLGNLNVLGQLAPIFPSAEQPQPQPPACHAHDAAVERRGELGLSVAVPGKEYPWDFVRRPGGDITITGQAPAGFPAGGRVYLVWEVPGVVKWQFAGGVVEEIPPGATWAVAAFGTAACGGKEEAGVERAPVASAPPAV